MKSSFSGFRILVVEDEMIVVWILEDMLTELGCTIVGPVSRVNRALTVMEVEAFDAALLDINLNGEKSYPIANALAAKGTPFAFSSGYNKDTLPAKYQVFPMLQKPFNLSSLSAMLTELLMSQHPMPVDIVAAYCRS
jgi:CheY-like chemotaxis protein